MSGCVRWKHSCSSLLKCVLAALLLSESDEGLNTFIPTGAFDALIAADGLTNLRLSDQIITGFRANNSVVKLCFFVDWAQVPGQTCGTSNRKQRNGVRGQ